MAAQPTKPLAIYAAMAGKFAVAIAKFTVSIEPELLRQIHELAQGERTVERVRRPLTMRFRPDNVLLAMEIQFKPNLSTADLVIAVDRLEAGIREAVPQIKQIYIEAESLKEAPRTG